MLPVLGLTMLPFASAARLPDAPAGVAQLAVRRDGSDERDAVEVVLRLERCWPDRGVRMDLAAQQDAVTTALTPALERRPGAETCLWVGHRLATHDAPGDTLVTYALLAETAGDAVQGVWYEDHMEVPRTLQLARGRLVGRALSLALEANELADAGRIEGLLRR